MTDTNPADVGLEPAAAAPLEGDSDSPVEEDNQPKLDAVALAAELAKTRQEAAKYRTKLKDFEDRDKTDFEKLTEERDGLKAALADERSARQRAAVQAAAVQAARKLNFREPDLAMRLISTAEVEFTDDGAPKNLEKLLAELSKEYPMLVNGAADFGGGPRGTPVPGGEDMNTRIRRLSGRP
jgi:hypothetical protein